MAKRDIVVIGGSAGALSALTSLVSKLRRDLPATVFVVLHIPPWHESALDKILRRNGEIWCVPAEHGEKFKQGTIYVARADHHLVLQDGHMLLPRGPKEHRNRPAIDPLFRSSALHYGPRTVGVLLSGMLDDGVSGLWQIKESGGMAIVQDPKEALQPQMPQNALDNVEVDHVLPVAKMAPLLLRLVNGRAGKRPKLGPQTLTHMKVEEKIVKMEDGITDIDKIATPSQYTCPECAGTLYEMREGKMVRYRCRTGHAYAEMALMAGQRLNTEDTLWAAMRALREKTELLRQRAKRRHKSDPSRAKLERIATTAEKQAIAIRDMIETLEGAEE